VASTKNNFYDDEFSENIFLDSLHKKNVKIFLLGGVKLVGKFYSHDGISILLKGDKSDSLVYKNSIASISEDNHKKCLN
jgi:RNA chaperone Hfq